MSVLLSMCVEGKWERVLEAKGKAATLTETPCNAADNKKARRERENRARGDRVRPECGVTRSGI